MIGAVALGAGLLLGGIVSGDPPFLTVVWWVLAAVAVQVPFTMAGLSLPRAPALWREARADRSARPAAVALTLAGAGLLAVPAGVAIGLAAGAQGVRYGLAAGIVAFEALFQTGAAIVDRGS